MSRADSSSFAAFAANSQPLFDSKVMFTHYSAETLFSAEARERYVAPDLEAIRSSLPVSIAGNHRMPNRRPQWVPSSIPAPPCRCRA